VVVKNERFYPVNHASLLSEARQADPDAEGQSTWVSCLPPRK
jgi:hypothetical protein